MIVRNCTQEKTTLGWSFQLSLVYANANVFAVHVALAKLIPSTVPNARITLC